MAPTAALPTLTAEPGFTHYVEEIRGFPILERQEEYMLAKRWREHGDRGAAHKLVTSHLRLADKGAWGRWAPRPIRRSCSSTCARPRARSRRWKRAICAPIRSSSSPSAWAWA